MCIAFRRIKEKIADTRARNMLMLLCNVGEHDATGDFGAGPHESRVLKVRLAEIRKSQQPENGIGYLLKDT